MRSEASTVDNRQLRTSQRAVLRILRTQESEFEKLRGDIGSALSLHQPPRRMQRLPTHAQPCLAKAQPLRPLRPLRQRHQHRIVGARFSWAGRHSLASLFVSRLDIYMSRLYCVRQSHRAGCLHAAARVMHENTTRLVLWISTADRPLKRWLVTRTFRPLHDLAKAAHEPSLYQCPPTALADT